MTTKELSSSSQLENTLQNQISVATAAWQEWHTQSIDERAAVMTTWAELLLQDAQFGALASEMVKYQKQQALALLAKTKVMPGPTGEVNELYCVGRGLFVITMSDIKRDLKSATISALVAQISVALLAGNSIILALPETATEIKSRLYNSLKVAGAAECVVQVCDYNDLIPLIALPQVAGVAYNGDTAMAQSLNRILSTRSGLIAPLVTELSGEALTSVTDSHFILRFITERTRTINITAVGGNATLLELGDGDH